MIEVRVSAAPFVLVAGLLPQSIAASQLHPTETPTAQLVECVIAGLSARCGHVTVFEDRRARAGRTIDLNIVVLPASGQDRLPDPVFILVGGPGEGATSTVAVMGAAFATIRRRRDLVFVDQRGTGESGALWCAPPAEPQGFFGAIFPRAVIEACRHRLEPRARLDLYSTPIAADDLDEVREALGYPLVNLYGVSYGTRAALVYLRRHRSHVRNVVLDAVAPPALLAPLWYARDAQGALARLFEDCAHDAPCHEAFPTLPQDFQLTVARLDTGVVVMIPRVNDSTLVSVRLTRGDFGYALRGMLYASDVSRLPALLHAAFVANDYRPFAEAYLRRAESLWQRLSFGMHLSVFCAEDVRRIPDAEVSRATRGTFLGDYVLREYQAACQGWPNAELPRGYDEPVRSQAPVLILSGRHDPVTPPRWGDAVAVHLPHSRHVVFQFGGHGTVPEPQCKVSIIARFLDGSPDRLDLSCARRMRATPFVMPPSPGAPDAESRPVSDGRLEPASRLFPVSWPTLVTRWHPPHLGLTALGRRIGGTSDQRVHGSSRHPRDRLPGP